MRVNVFVCICIYYVVCVCVSVCARVHAIMYVYTQVICMVTRINTTYYAAVPFSDSILECPRTQPAHPVMAMSSLPW